MLFTMGYMVYVIETLGCAFLSAGGKANKGVVMGGLLVCVAMVLLVVLGCLCQKRMNCDWLFIVIILIVVSYVTIVVQCNGG